MYLDFIKNDYSDKPEEERGKYIERDKEHLGSIIQEKIANDLEEIVDRWYELNDVGCIPINEKFIYLLKEAENLYVFGYYTGTIAVVGIACEEYCKYLMNENDVEEVENQYARIDVLKEKSIINNDTKNYLHRIRKLRNNCIHYNINFKTLDENELKKNAFSIIEMYKKCLSVLSVKRAYTAEELEEKLIKSRIPFNDFKYRNRNIYKKTSKIDLQLSPEISSEMFTSKYYIAEIDTDTDAFKEITLVDIDRGFIPLVVDLTLPQVELLKRMNVEEKNIIIASVVSSVTTLGQTEEWHLLNIRDVYRVKVELDDLENYI
ncbi:DUF4145 domain-containing protein [Clostridium butyricum]|uniref:DUF4145 domain-containing protein n=1 Tax=Clostridium butyricum TaxID=1492 RepID=UPI0013D4F8AE|nr:DUF4145 domain-containing protein [Clostridium butyricum]MCQ2017147.1 DUF4145 domain-containing protein [Clostridium butyricum]MCQ2021027.1 DUF4145 domain-containing protein [Clostridium butyricum]UTY53708.1 DUF4145 domain-containing protein [Clostridium butyricum]